MCLLSNLKYEALHFRIYKNFQKVFYRIKTANFCHGWEDLKFEDNLKYDDDDLKYENDCRYDDNLKYKDDLKFEDDLNHKYTLKYEDNLNSMKPSQFYQTKPTNLIYQTEQNIPNQTFQSNKAQHQYLLHKPNGQIQKKIVNQSK